MATPWLLELVHRMGYLGVFIASFLGTLSILFPVPYLAVAYLMGASGGYNPLLIGLAGGLGAALGEMPLYFLARVGRLALKERTLRGLDLLRTFLGRYGVLIILLFAATPLPDDVIYPALGLMKYDVAKLFLACFAGKTVLTTVVALAGELSIEVLDIFMGEAGFYTQVAVIILIAVSVFIVLKIDWEKLLSRFAGVGQG